MPQTVRVEGVRDEELISPNRLPNGIVGVIAGTTDYELRHTVGWAVVRADNRVAILTDVGSWFHPATFESLRVRPLRPGESITITGGV